MQGQGGLCLLVSLVYTRKEIWSLPRTVLKTVYIPNVRVEWVTFLLRVQMPASALGPKNWNIYDSTQSVETNLGIIRRIRPRRLSSSSFSIHHSITVLQFDTIYFKVLKPCTNEVEYRRLQAAAHLLHTSPRNY